MKKRYNFKVRSVIFLAGTLIIITTLLILLDMQIRPIIVTIANNQSRITAVLAINEAVTNELTEHPELYSDLLLPHFDSSGNMVSLNANTLLINEAKANLTEVVAKELEQLEDRTVSIPLGTVLGWQLLAGKGPQLRFSVIPTSYVESDIVTKIETAGINQTKNSIYMRFSVTVSAIIPGYTTSVDIENDVLIADVLVVGDTPEYYGTTNGDNLIEPIDII